MEQCKTCESRIKRLKREKTRAIERLKESHRREVADLEAKLRTAKKVGTATEKLSYLKGVKDGKLAARASLVDWLR